MQSKARRSNGLSHPNFIFQPALCPTTQHSITSQPLPRKEQPRAPTFTHHNPPRNMVTTLATLTDCGPHRRLLAWLQLPTVLTGPTVGKCGKQEKGLLFSTALELVGSGRFCSLRVVWISSISLRSSNPSSSPSNCDYVESRIVVGVNQFQCESSP